MFRLEITLELQKVFMLFIGYSIINILLTYELTSQLRTPHPLLCLEKYFLKKCPSGLKLALNGIKQSTGSGMEFLFCLILTFPTQINTNFTVKQIFSNSQAPYRLLFNGYVHI